MAKKKTARELLEAAAAEIAAKTKEEANSRNPASSFGANATSTKTQQKNASRSIAGETTPLQTARQSTQSTAQQQKTATDYINTRRQERQTKRDNTQAKIRELETKLSATTDRRARISYQRQILDLKYPLSDAEKSLVKNSEDRYQLQKNKEGWDTENALGIVFSDDPDMVSMSEESKAMYHRWNELIRAKYGFSGGDAGMEKITQSLNESEKKYLDTQSQEELSRVRALQDFQKRYGDLTPEMENTVTQTEQKILSKLPSTRVIEDAHGRTTTIQTKSETQKESEKDENEENYLKFKTILADTPRNRLENERTHMYDKSTMAGIQQGYDYLSKEYDRPITERIANVAKAAANQFAGGYAETLGQYLTPESESTPSRSSRYVMEGDKEGIAAAQKEAKARSVAADKLYDAAQERLKLSEEQTLAAKKGLGSAGKLLVDAGVAGLQMGADLGVSAITGTPNMGLVNMGTRVFGLSANEARNAGASQYQQLMYGLAGAGTEVLTEKLFGAFKNAYGEGFLDNAMMKAIGKFVKSPAAAALGKDIIGEGLEEVIASAVNPILQSIYTGEAPSYSMDTLSEAMYEGLVGAVLGGIGGSVNLVKGEKKKGNTANQRTQFKLDAEDLAYNAKLGSSVFNENNPIDIRNLTANAGVSDMPTQTGSLGNPTPTPATNSTTAPTNTDNIDTVLPVLEQNQADIGKNAPILQGSNTQANTPITQANTETNNQTNTQTNPLDLLRETARERADIESGTSPVLLNDLVQRVDATESAKPVGVRDVSLKPVTTGSLADRVKIKKVKKIEDKVDVRGMTDEDSSSVYFQSLTNQKTITKPEGMTEERYKAAVEAGKTAREAKLNTLANAVKDRVVHKEDAGFYGDANSFDSATVQELHDVSKALGVRTYLVGSVDGGKANAKLYMGDVFIEKDNPNPVRSLKGHESGHRMRELSPKLWQDFQDYVAALPGAYEKVQRKIKLYRDNDKTLDVDGALEEVACDYAGQLSEDYDALRQFIEDNIQKKSFLRKVAEAFKRVAEKLTGKRKSDVDRAIDLLQRAAKGAYEVVKASDGGKNTVISPASEDVKGKSIENAMSEAEEFSDADTKYSIRDKEPPKNTGIAYKVFLADKDGNLFPPMVANPGGASTPTGVWLDADSGKQGEPSKTGRPQVQGGGKGTNSGKISLAFRPGWHLGDIPLAKQFAKKNPETGEKDLFPKNFVWAECEYAMDKDYQDEAMSYGYTDKGKFRHSYAGLPRVPEDGYYRYRTNPNPDTVPWVITGAMKVNRILTDEETDKICRDNGVEPMKRLGGPIDLAEFGLDNQPLSGDSVKYSLKEQKIPTFSELMKKPDVKVIDIAGEEAGRTKEFAKSFKLSDEAKEICKTPVRNKDTGEYIFITPSTFTHSFSNSPSDKVSVARNIRGIVENSVLTSREDSRKEGDHTTGVYTLFGAVRTNRGIQPIKVKVKEYSNEGQDIPKNIRESIGDDFETYSSVYDNRILVVEGIEKETDGSAALTANQSAIPDSPSVSAISVADLYSLVNEKYRKYWPENKDSGKFSLKESQLKSIQRENPAEDDIHTWIRTVDDILTFDEAVNGFSGEDIAPDYTADMVERAKDTGEITVFSSKPIETGVFVTPSRMEAKNYAGGGKVYEKTVKLEDVAWVDEIQGQYAPENDTAKFSLKEQDADYLSAVESGDMETAQRMVDDAAKRAGYTEKMYHGSKNGGGFTRFEDWAYFTRNKAYAERYKERENPGSLYESYVKLEKPFDTRDEEAAEIFNDARMEYGMNEILESGLPDWTDGYDIADYIDENDLDYDGIVLDEGGDLVDGVPVSRGESYVVRKSAQIKSADPVTYDDNGNVIPLSERFNADDEDIRYSLKGTGDYTTAKLEKQNALLKEKMEYWKSQTRRTKLPTCEPKAVKKSAKRILKTYQSGADAETVTASLQELWDGVSRGESFEESDRKAREVAETIARAAVEEDSELYDNYADMRKFFKDTKITITKGDKEGITDYKEWRNANRKYFNISVGEHTNVDTVFQEAAVLWPEWFDERETSNIHDQLNAISDVLSTVYTVTEFNPFGGNMENAVEGIANDILYEYFELPQVKTFADKQADRLKQSKAAGRQAVENTRTAERMASGRELAKQKRADAEKFEKMFTRKNQQLDDLREKNRQRVNAIIQKERETTNRKLSALKDEYARRNHVSREKRDARELRGKITRHLNKLSTKLLRPNDKQHIPESLKKSVATLLESINLESKGGKATKKTEAFLALRDSYRKLTEEESSVQYIVDPDLEKKFKEIEEWKDTPILELDSEKLRTIYDTILAIETSITNVNKAFRSERFQTISGYADSIKAGTRDVFDRQVFKKGSSLQNMMAVNMLTPEAYFHRLGEAGDEVFRMLRAAQDRQITILDEAKTYIREKFKGVKLSKLEKDIRHITVEDGEFDMSVAQIMNLYLLSKRDQGMKHILAGGIRPDALDGKGIYKTQRSISIHITQDELSEIVGMLTDEQAKYADALQSYAEGTLAKLGNEASMEIYGYEKFKEKHYWPIKVDKAETKSDVAKEALSATIAGKGFTKGIDPNANNAVMVSSVFDVFTTHTAEMTAYSAWLPAVENLKRIHNFRFYEPDENGKNKGGTVKNILDRVFGLDVGNNYMEKLLEDINGGVNALNDNPFDRFTGAYKASAIGANIRVWIQQPTSAIRALDTISLSDFVAGLAKSKPGTWDKVKKYAPIAVWKDWGYFDADTGKRVKDVLFGETRALDKVNNALIKPAGTMDSLAWSHLWNACEVEVHRKNMALRPGTDAFYKEVAKRFNEVVDHSQVVDGVIQRSHIMRSTNGVTKMATSFMSEPTKTYSMFLNAIYDVRHAADKKAARKHLGRTAFALTASLVTNAAAQSIVDALRASGDDRDKDYWENFFTELTGVQTDTDEEQTAAEKVKDVANGNLFTAFNPAGYIPFVKDIWSIVQGYDVERMDMSAISKIIENGITAVKALKDGGTKTKQNAILSLVTETARLFGVPAANIKRDVLSVYNTWANATGNYAAQYAMTKFLYNPENTYNRSKFTSILQSAYDNGDTAQAEALKKQMISDGLDVAENVMGKDAITEGVHNSPLYKGASDETKKKYDTMIGTIARGSGQDGVYDKINELQEAGLDESYYILYKIALEKADEDNNNRASKKEANKALEIMPGYSGFTPEQRKALIHVANKSW